MKTEVAVPKFYQSFQQNYTMESPGKLMIIIRAAAATVSVTVENIVYIL
jgi:hypothetical protein